MDYNRLMKVAKLFSKKAQEDIYEPDSIEDLIKKLYDQKVTFNNPKLKLDPTMVRHIVNYIDNLYKMLPVPSIDPNFTKFRQNAYRFATTLQSALNNFYMDPIMENSTWIPALKNNTNELVNVLLSTRTPPVQKGLKTELDIPHNMLKKKL